MRIFTLISMTLAALLMSATAFAAPKEPWQWTPEERLAGRLSSSARAERVETARRSGKSNGRIPEDVIDGGQHPELLPPTELFEALVQRVYVSPCCYRATIEAMNLPIFASDADWSKLEEVSGTVVALQKQRDRLRK